MQIYGRLAYWVLEVKFLKRLYTKECCMSTVKSIYYARTIWFQREIVLWWRNSSSNSVYASEIDENDHVQGCLIDLQKTFNILDHKLLTFKLYNYSFRGKIHDIIVNFLSDGKQYVSYLGTNTLCLNDETVLPQDSVLGPFLFLPYINDINLGESDCKLAIFVDYTTINKDYREGCCSNWTRIRSIIWTVLCE